MGNKLKYHVNDITTVFDMGREIIVQNDKNEILCTIQISSDAVMGTNKFMKELEALILNFIDTKNNNLEERKATFMRAVIEATKLFPDKELIEDFIRCWTEHNPNGKKMKFEMQKTFSINGRLATFVKNKKTNFGKGTFADKQNVKAVATQPTIPVRVEGVKKVVQKSPEQLRTEMVSASMSVFNCFKTGQAFIGAQVVYDFLLKEKGIVWSEGDEKELRLKVTAEIESAIYHYKLDNRISPNTVLKAGEGPRLDPDMVFKKVALKKYFSQINELKF